MEDMRRLLIHLLVAGLVRMRHNGRRRLEELLPRPRRVEIPDASHFVHENNAPAYNDAVLSFMAAAEAV